MKYRHTCVYANADFPQNKLTKVLPPKQHTNEVNHVANGWVETYCPGKKCGINIYCIYSVLYFSMWWKITYSRLSAGSAQSSLPFKLRKCLLHCPGFGHQITGAPAANQITLFSLIQFKYSTLTHQIRSPDGVVVSTSGYSAMGWITIRPGHAYQR